MIQSGQDLPQFEAVALIEEERRPEPNLVREESGDPGDDKSFPLEEARRLAQAILRLDGLTGAASVSGKVVEIHYGAGPPEDCGVPQAFMERRAAAPWRVRELLDDLLEDIKAGDAEALDYRIEELQPWQEWLMLHRFDRRRVNRRLRQYAEGEPEWMSAEGGRQ
jgi:hypothetical protein